MTLDENPGATDFSESSFDHLPSRLEEGDELAANEVFRRFTARLIGLARRRLDERLAGKVDADDVVQSVYRSFFLRQQAEPFELQSWDDLWALLATITVRKCGRQSALFRTSRRDLHRERTIAAENNDDGVQAQIATHAPSAEEVVALQEILERMLADLNPDKREMLILRLQGYTFAEISQKVGRTERSVFRLMRAIKDKLMEIDREI